MAKVSLEHSLFIGYTFPAICYVSFRLYFIFINHTQGDQNE